MKAVQLHTGVKAALQLLNDAGAHKRLGTVQQHSHYRSQAQRRRQ
jgi:hypothetical protein